MARKVQVIYENGVFRPLQKVDIEENARLDITISPDENGSEDNPEKLLMELLDNPNRMGRILMRSRREIYDDIA